MAGDRITEVFNVERALESGSEETSERSDERCEGRENYRVKLERGPGDRSEFASGLEERKTSVSRPNSTEGGCTDDRFDRGQHGSGKREPPPFEDVIRRALDVGEGTRREVLHGADHVVVTHEERAPL